MTHTFVHPRARPVRALARLAGPVVVATLALAVLLHVAGPTGVSSVAREAAPAPDTASWAQRIIAPPARLAPAGARATPR